MAKVLVRKSNLEHLLNLKMTKENNTITHAFMGQDYRKQHKTRIRGNQCLSMLKCKSLSKSFQGSKLSTCTSTSPPPLPHTHTQILRILTSTMLTTTARLISVILETER